MLLCLQISGKNKSTSVSQHVCLGHKSSIPCREDLEGGVSSLFFMLSVLLSPIGLKSRGADSPGMAMRFGGQNPGVEV